jgi:carboxylesterase
LEIEIVKTSELTSPTVRRCAKPIDYAVGNRRVVLGLHGFTGYPGELAYPAQMLSESGWDVRVPRLLGHGTSGDDFRKFAVEDWRSQIYEEWKGLNDRYDEVCILGHSLGGLLGLDLASRYPVGKTAVMAPAIGIHIPGQSIIKLVSLIVERKPYPWKPDPRYTFFDDRDPDDDEYLGAEYWSWTWYRPLAGLLGLQTAVERRLDGISGSVLGIFGENDTVVGKKGRILLDSKLKSRFEGIELPGCGHYIPYESNPGSKEAAMNAVIEWLEG